MRILSLLLIAVLASSLARAQYSKVSLNLTGGYVFDDKVHFDAAYTKVKGGFNYGGGLEYFPSRNSSVELSYSRLDTHFPLYTNAGVQIKPEVDNSGAINYILLGGNSYFPKSYDSKLLPFVGGGVGVGWFEGNKQNSSAKFAFNIKAGAKIKTNSVVSFKLNAYLQSIISTFGSDVWYTWYGPIAVADYATLWQFGLGGAICFDFKPKTASK